MTFMQPDVFRDSYYLVEADHGALFVVPLSVSGVVATSGELQDYVDGEIDDPESAPDLRRGWVARMSAPGYLDCTPWEAFDSQSEALEYLEDLYGIDNDDDDPDAEGEEN